MDKPVTTQCIALFGFCPLVWVRPLTFKGALKKGGQAAQALGRSRGGWSTKIHAGCRDERIDIAIVLTAGHWHESPVFETLLAQVPPE